MKMTGRRSTRSTTCRRSELVDAARDLTDLDDQVRGRYAVVQNGNGTTELVDLGTKRPIMCNFPDEIADALEFVEIAHGRVVVLGLGLGMIVRMLLRNPDVERIDVVEISPEIIEMVAPSIEGERVRVHRMDALDARSPEQLLLDARADYVWSDIFPTPRGIPCRIGSARWRFGGRFPMR